MKVPYSVITPTYNRSAALQGAMASLLQQTIPKEQYEVLIIDDESKDDTPRVTEEFIRINQAKNFFYHRIPHGGPAKARNVGIKLARGEILFFTDDDCVVPPDWMEKLLGGYRRYPNAVGVGGAFIRPPAVISKSKFAQYDQWVVLQYPFRQLLIVNNHGEYAPGKYASPNYTRAGGTGNVSYKKWLFEKIGGLDENLYFPGNEDLEFVLRVMQHQYLLVYCAVFVMHNKPTDLKTLAKKHFMSGRGSYYIFQKYKVPYVYPPLSFSFWFRYHVRGGLTFVLFWCLQSFTATFGWYYEVLRGVTRGPSLAGR